MIITPSGNCSLFFILNFANDQNFRFLKSKIQQFTRRTDIDAAIRALVFCSAGVWRVSRPALEARKQAFCGLR